MGEKRLLAAPHEEALGVSVHCKGRHISVAIWLAHSGDRLPAAGRDREQTCNNAAEAYEIQSTGVCLIKRLSYPNFNYATKMEYPRREVTYGNPGRLTLKCERRMKEAPWGMRVILPFLLPLVALWGVTPHPAQAGSGLYLSGELGANFASGLDTIGSSNDRASACDEFINPLYASVTQTPGYEDYNCTGPNRGLGGNWHNNFDSAEGILAGAAVGYSLREKFPDRALGRLRLELEYFYRDSNYDQTSPLPGATGAEGDKLVQEIISATERIGSVTSNNLFGNLYIDFPNKSRFTPYLGLGGGVAFTDMDYGMLAARNPDPNAISTGAGLPNVDEIRRNLAGSASIAQTKLKDTLYGYQILFGVDRMINESLTLGLKGRWVNFSSFSDGGIVWDLLRGHQPNLRKDLSEPVSGWLTTGDLRMFGISLTMKYHF